MKSSDEALRAQCNTDELPELEKMVGLKVEQGKVAFAQLKKTCIGTEEYRNSYGCSILFRIVR